LIDGFRNALKLAWREKIIAVQKGNPLTARDFNADVPARRNALPTVVDPHFAAKLMLCKELSGDISSVVGAAIVNDDHLEILLSLIR
jgi:hypothetical protein